MRVQTNSVLTTIGVLLAVLVTETCAQVNLPFGPANYEHDLQVFAPLELDLDNLPADDGNCGYFFEYNKLYWSYSGERVTIGDPNVVEFAEEVYLQNPARASSVDGTPLPADQGDRPEPYQIQNALTSVPPLAGFALGDRYEIGYKDRDNGWLISVLDGPGLYETKVYGFGEFNPTIDPDYTDGTDLNNEDGTTTGPVGEARAFGFGSVPVLFQTPPGFMLGFRDYLQNLGGAQAGTVGGPVLYVGNYGIPVFEEGDEVDDDVLFRRADDLDEDGIWGFAVIVNADDEIIGFITDFDDLHTFNVYFDQVTVNSFVETDGVEVMWSHNLSNANYMAKRQNNRLELSYGARFFRFHDNFRVEALGSILGDSFWDTTLDNQIVGPQVALSWGNQRQRWTFNADVKFTFGYNVQDWSQEAGMGSELIPGALNRPLYGRPTYTAQGQQRNEFSPLAELRLETAYHLTKAVALKAGYTGMFAGNIRRAATSVRYALPTMGFQDVGTQNLVVNGLHFGVEFVH